MFNNEENFKIVIDRLKIDDKPTASHKQTLRAQILQTFNATRQKDSQTKTSTQTFWRTIMKSPITKLAAAAVIVIAAGLLLYEFTGFIDVSSKAFAQVIEQVHKATSVKYKCTIQDENKTPWTYEVMINENGVTRNSGGDYTVIDRTKGITLTLYPVSKSARLYKSVAMPEKQRLFNRLDWLTTLREKATEYIGQERIETMQTDLYKFKEPFRTILVWVNPRTNLPVRVIVEHFPNPNPDIIIPRVAVSANDFGVSSDVIYAATGGSSDVVVQKHFKSVYSDFEWNIDIDPTLFSTEPPADYTVVDKLTFNEADESATDIIAALQFWTETSDDSLPVNINELVDPNKIKVMLLKKFHKGQDPNEEFRRAYEFANDVILKAVCFAQDKKAQKNWYNSSEPVSFGETDKPLYWWKEENSNKYRVIYGDLSIRDVNDMPQ
jgi:hypothetical protein